MSLPTVIGAYSDCFRLYDAAIATPGGARAPFATYDEARLFQTRMHQARTLQRKQNQRVYASDHPLHGTSEFDSLQVVVRADFDTTNPQDSGEWWVLVKPAGHPNLHIEPIEAQPSDDLA